MGLRDIIKSGAIDSLEQRVVALEADVLELRRHHLRLAELTDLVSELLVPMASRDQARIDAALERFTEGI